MTTPHTPDQRDDRDDLVIRVNASGLSIFIRRWRPVLAWLGGIVAAVLAIVFSVKVMHGLRGARTSKCGPEVTSESLLRRHQCQCRLIELFRRKGRWHDCTG